MNNFLKQAYFLNQVGADTQQKEGIENGFCSGYGGAGRKNVRPEGGKKGKNEEQKEEGLHRLKGQIQNEGGITTVEEEQKSSSGPLFAEGKTNHKPWNRGDITVVFSERSLPCSE